MPLDPEWYKRAVFYEALVRAFSDSDGDGTGDLDGLTAKLDYLAWLGIDCIWLPPFYDSPLRDGGYDISDFRAVLPEFGTVENFVTLLDEAHKRGIRIITDLVMNHTSDQHLWFQESRRDPEGPYGDFYVWSDDDSKYADARIIFIDTESSNWTYDPVRGQFYWHRFFSHQPDLNFENEAVQEAMLDVLRFWLDLGIDGFRLDAVPYLFEEEGTNCENLPRTHEFLKRCRKVVEDEYPGRVLLAEANQWPADVVEYFGDPSVGGDECHMAFHFPLMPRIFMAVRRQSRFPISEILAQTPEIPEGAQWGIFLRNHDELTLEMVTDEERDYMYTEYAKDPRMRANVGIRRRLAPLLDNDRNQIELFTAMLLSLPGSPVLYYGDEIGMGDNIWLGDRDGVRTPMQWTPDRNAGFSVCDPGRIYLPVIMDPIYGYQVTNVEAQLGASASLLHWTRRMIEIRQQHQAFPLGSFTDLGGSNPTVLAYVREYVGADGEHDIVICVNNLSRFPQPVELDLGRFRGCTPVELTGRVHFPPIGELPYLLTLPGHGFYWFQLTPHEERG
ncbi:maltose alpha-D-glucosyltransferase [Cryptosporangium japonicum]